jgi:flagellar protein FliL
MTDVPVVNAADADAAPKSKKKWLIIALAAVVVLAGGGAAAFLLLGNKDAHKKEAAKEKAPPAPALYVALEPPFVVNFEGDQMVRFLQISVQIMTRKPEIVEVLKSNDPMIRNDLLLLFGNQKYDVLSTREGKEKLRSDALGVVKHVVQASGGKAEEIENVFFTSFVMQ